jgi:hypothetical protein
VFLIHVDHDYLNQAMVIANQNRSEVNNIRCQPCDAILFFDPNPMQVLTESYWTPSSNPAINQDAFLRYQKGYTDTTWGKEVAWIALHARASVNWTAADVSELKGAPSVKEHIFGGFTSVSMELKVNSWTTFAYGNYLEPVFTALPPES